MRKLVMLVSLFIVSLNSFAQIQVFEKIAKGAKPAIDINFFGYGKIDTSANAKFKMTYFALVEEKWAEGLVGVSYTPVKWCEIGLSAGIESVSSLYRVSASIWLGNDKFSFFSCVEKGEGRDNWWYKSVANYNVNKNISLGLMSWRYNNTGLFLKYNNVRFGVSPWVNVGRDLEFGINRISYGLDIKL
ncbi:MAG: hypothetical protein NT165_02670 [Candidatus Falkowbacteria bacterium]|nr:hypothetical protein [Candidatus Falkowbacteria bacterium]